MPWLEADGKKKELVSYSGVQEIWRCRAKGCVVCVVCRVSCAPYVVSKHQGTGLDGEFARVRVLGHARRQTGRRGGLAGRVDTSGHQRGHVPV
jgi:hypothetical protein